MKELLAQTGAVLRTKLFQIGDTPITVSTLVTLLLIFVGTLLLSKWLRRLSTRLLAKRNQAAASTVGALIHYAVLVVGFSSALSTAGVNLTGLFAAGAIFAVGLGFAMKSIVENFVSGIILLVERSIKPGDVLEVEGVVVQVMDMGIRASIVVSRNGEEIIIPNAILSQNSVKNYTMRNSSYRIRIPVGVTYDSDMKLVRTILEQVAAEVSERWGAKQAPQVVMTGFGSSSVDWEVGVWMEDPWGYRTASSQLHEAVWSAFHEAGIVIAFPQLDVHFDRPVTESLRTLSGEAA